MSPIEVVQTASPADELWFKDAIVYQLHVKAFSDSNGDGVGDFAGLTERLDYLQELGVTALWLLPFYPSPGRDDGYDIADYRRINPDFGTMKDFRRFLTEAHRRGLRVVTELVINHTSDQHPWFKRARRSRRGSDARDWYVWSDTDQKYLETRIIFTDTEKSNWTWDAEAQAYYWHRFFSHQPDLNFDNPRVLWAVIQVMRRWLDMGVDGFRLDAIPYLVERDGTNNENLPETHAVIKKIRAELDAHAPGKVLLAEANQWPEDVSAYFGDGDECHMAYHFPLMPRIYMAIAQEDRFPIADILRQTPDIPANCQWALFLRNHDELTLEMVTDSERDYLWSTYAADPRARINLGIRRRLAPLMENDRRKIELMNSLLMSLPGTPVIYYGDEIGMGDNIYLGDRNGVRTPMQWTPDRNGGFSRADPAKLYLPPIMDPVYGFQAVNVEAQSRSLSSLLSWMKRLIAVRKSSHVFGRGSLTFIRPDNRKVLAYVRQYQGETILCVANLSRSAQAAELDLSQWAGRRPLEMLGRTTFSKIGEAPYMVTLAPYGFFWFLLNEQSGAPEIAAHAPELPTVVIRDGWGDLLHGRSRHILEREVLPLFLPARRWFAEKGSGRVDVRLDAAIPLPAGEPGVLWSVIETKSDRGASFYSLPLTVLWGREHAVPPAFMLGPARRAHREGLLTDAVCNRDFIGWFMRQLAAGATIAEDGMVLRFRPADAFAGGELPGFEETTVIGAEQSNTAVAVGGGYLVKFFRRLCPGANPDVEIGRFLTERTAYRNTPAFVGSVELHRHDRAFDVAIVQEFVGNQGDGWALTATYLGRFLEEAKLLAPAAGPPPDQHAGYLLRMQQLGKRTAELHVALASRDDDPDFAPVRVSEADLQRRARNLLELVEQNFAELRRRLATLPESVATLADRLSSRRERAIAAARDWLPTDPRFFAARCHGDLHLGQVLIVKDDVFIIDFEGEPGRSLDERRRKAPVARDVAGVVRSLDYAAQAALDRVPVGSPEERGRVVAALDGWRRQSIAAFFEAYRAGMSDPRLWPAAPERAADLLRFFTLEKAIYEIGYELANRPAWLHAPLAGTWRLLFPDESAPA